MHATSNHAVLKMLLPTVLLVHCCAVAVCHAQAAAPNVPALDIALEQQIGGKAVSLPPTHVFESGDTIRFRVTSRFDGYIYVMDQGTSGKFATAFPSATAGSDNRIHLGQIYLIPSTVDGWFQVSGPAGFDVIYFLLSPEPIVTPAAASLAAPGTISSLKPRCNDAAFRARGECLDVTAGPAPLPRDAPLPAPLAPLAGAASRDITVTKKKDSVTITSEGSKSAPVIYTFRLAHN
jgi:hypothetical protein